LLSSAVRQLAERTSKVLKEKENSEAVSISQTAGQYKGTVL